MKGFLLGQTIENRKKKKLVVHLLFCLQVKAVSAVVKKNIDMCLTESIN